MNWIDGVLRDVAELPDRNSPADQPEVMLVTAAELRQILEAHWIAASNPVRLTDEEVADFVEALNVEEDKHCHMTVSNGEAIVLAIESAVLRKQGFNDRPARG